MLTAKQAERQLRIKTGGLVRYKKDMMSYAKELQQQENKLAKQMEEGQDEYTVKKLKEMIEETKAVLQQLNGKIKMQYEMVEEAIKVAEEVEGMEENEQLEKSRAAYKDVGEYIQYL